MKVVNNLHVVIITSTKAGWYGMPLQAAKLRWRTNAGGNTAPGPSSLQAASYQRQPFAVRNTKLQTIGGGQKENIGLILSLFLD